VKNLNKFLKAKALVQLVFPKLKEVQEHVVLGHAMMLNGVQELLQLRIVNGLMFQRARRLPPLNQLLKNLLLGRVEDQVEVAVVPQEAVPSK
jgi:hypothetical protein